MGCMKDEDLALLEIVRQRLEKLQKEGGAVPAPEDIYPEEDTDTFRDWTGED